MVPALLSKLIRQFLRRLVVLSIAAIGPVYWGLTAIATPVTTDPIVSASENETPSTTYFLPTLGNTEESDREMLREVSDRHVHESESAERSMATADSEDKEMPTDIWALIRASKPMPIRVTKAVKAQQKQYIKEALWVNKILQRATPYLPSIVARLQERNMPLDLAFIPAVESAFQAHVSSSGEAAGLWQIVPITAKEIGLKRTPWFDQRADLVHSTRAALDYLSYLNAEFHGDWELTLAAYNAGPGRVKSAVRRAMKNSQSVDFWSLKLPPETVAYVPKITALVTLIRQQPESPLELPPISTNPTYKLVDVGQRISLDKAAALAGIPESRLRLYNSGLIHDITPPRGPHRLLLPIEASDAFEDKLARVSSTDLFSLPKMHVVAAGDTISSIAHGYGIKQQTLRELNGLTGSKILLGQKLAVLDARHSIRNKQEMLSYTIKHGDTLSGIARRFNVKMADIRFIEGSDADSSDADSSDAGDQVLIPGKKLTIQIRSTDGNG